MHLIAVWWVSFQQTTPRPCPYCLAHAHAERFGSAPFLQIAKCFAKSPIQLGGNIGGNYVLNCSAFIGEFNSSRVTRQAEITPIRGISSVLVGNEGGV